MNNQWTQHIAELTKQVEALTLDRDRYKRLATNIADSLGKLLKQYSSTCIPDEAFLQAVTMMARAKQEGVIE